MIVLAKKYAISLRAIEACVKSCLSILRSSLVLLSLWVSSVCIELFMKNLRDHLTKFQWEAMFDFLKIHNNIMSNFKAELKN